MKIKGTMRHFCWLLPVAFVVWYARRNCPVYSGEIGGIAFTASIPLDGVVVISEEAGR